MAEFRQILLRSTFASIVVVGVMSAATSPTDLSKYRNFRLGTNLSIVSKQAGAKPSDVKTIHRSPALIQELEWRPEFLSSGAQTEPPKKVILRFYEGELFLITVSYDRYGTEGLTTADMIAAISATYGLATEPAAAVKSMHRGYADMEDVIAEWQDLQYRFLLILTSDGPGYGPRFRMVGVLKRLETQAHAAMLEANRLDDQEATRHDAALRANEEEAHRLKLEETRLINKPKFRP